MTFQYHLNNEQIDDIVEIYTENLNEIVYSAVSASCVNGDYSKIYRNLNRGNVMDIMINDSTILVCKLATQQEILSTVNTPSFKQQFIQNINQQTHLQMFNDKVVITTKTINHYTPSTSSIYQIQHQNIETNQSNDIQYLMIIITILSGIILCCFIYHICCCFIKKQINSLTLEDSFSNACHFNGTKLKRQHTTSVATHTNETKHKDKGKLELAAERAMVHGNSGHVTIPLQ